ncbi:MAG: hypothetical protein RsTaC01_0219 [Candidatus Paraimprobicoccus trichonymphae]|uniref:Uncharacterized protein n=1 Tax=Candidatus Paraimprobicoccus trichonymphae TaxID=3033793 RepID=A0AA48I5I9_9FIRM|nr:MAG: hypothetical protein RsTaC01_0219 [Candidatus Paraimprobicoccus trichonymphae]
MGQDMEQKKVINEIKSMLMNIQKEHYSNPFSPSNKLKINNKNKSTVEYLFGKNGIMRKIDSLESDTVHWFRSFFDSSFHSTTMSIIKKYKEMKIDTKINEFFEYIDYKNEYNDLASKIKPILEEIENKNLNRKRYKNKHIKKSFNSNKPFLSYTNLIYYAKENSSTKEYNRNKNSNELAISEVDRWDLWYLKLGKYKIQDLMDLKTQYNEIVKYVNEIEKKFDTGTVYVFLNYAIKKCSTIKVKENPNEKEELQISFVKAVGKLTANMTTDVQPFVNDKLKDLRSALY